MLLSVVLWSYAPEDHTLLAQFQGRGPEGEALGAAEGETEGLAATEGLAEVESDVAGGADLGVASMPRQVG